MCARKVLLKIVRTAFGDQMDRQARRICRHQRPRLPHRLDALEKLPLDLEVLGNRFDDPVGLAAPRQVIFEIAGGDEPRCLGCEERHRARLLRRIESREHDPVPHRGFLERQPFAPLVGIQFRRDNIKQTALDAGVGQVSGDSRAHRSRSEHRCFFDWASHRDGTTWLQKRQRRSTGNALSLREVLKLR